MSHLTDGQCTHTECGCTCPACVESRLAVRLPCRCHECWRHRRWIELGLTTARRPFGPCQGCGRASCGELLTEFTGVLAPNDRGLTCVTAAACGAGCRDAALRSVAGLLGLELERPT